MLDTLVAISSVVAALGLAAIGLGGLVLFVALAGGFNK